VPECGRTVTFFPNSPPQPALILLVSAKLWGQHAIYWKCTAAAFKDEKTRHTLQRLDKRFLAVALELDRLGPPRK